MSTVGTARLAGPADASLPAAAQGALSTLSAVAVAVAALVACLLATQVLSIRSPVAVAGAAHVSLWTNDRV